MIKRLLEKQIVFNWTLGLLSIMSKWKISRGLIPMVTKILAHLNLKLNRPEKTNDLEKLAKSWQDLMPPDGQNFYRIAEIKDDTAFVEIHLKCPLRGTGKVNTCHSFMNYDRTLMKNIGGSLTVLDSQSNSGKPFCRLAIRKSEDSINDLVPAHLKA